MAAVFFHQVKGQVDARVIPARTEQVPFFSYPLTGVAIRCGGRSGETTRLRHLRDIAEVHADVPTTGTVREGLDKLS